MASFRFRWTAEPGIDLLTGPVPPLRAFVVSYWVGVDTSDVDSCGTEVRRLSRVCERGGTTDRSRGHHRLPDHLRVAFPGDDVIR
jgi:hypothetical protein